MANELKPTIEISITTKMYGWSKYGGARFGLVKEILPEWYCQICAEKQTLSLPSYMLSDGDEREFLRICSKCKSKVNKHGVKTYSEAFRLRKLFT